LLDGVGRGDFVGFDGDDTLADESALPEERATPSRNAD
jgi:hypothetical protein